jgi:hypothetical protein
MEKPQSGGAPAKCQSVFPAKRVFAGGVPVNAAAAGPVAGSQSGGVGRGEPSTW